MKKFKTQKGITLVALIITIVVLLILAAVAIGAVKDSDIVGYAKNAAGSFNQAKANELDYLAKYEEELKKYAGDNGAVPDELSKYILGQDEKGRSASDILDLVTLIAKQDPQDPTSTVHEKVKFSHIEGNETYFRYNRDVYKVKLSTITYNGKEIPDKLLEGTLVKVNSPEGNLGKYVTYANNTWIVLRDDSNGVELISANGIGDFAFGESNFNAGRTNYNNAVATIVNECKTATGIISNIRSVGSTLTIEEALSDSNTVNFEEIARTTDFSPTAEIDEFNQYEGEMNGLRKEDTNYEADYAQMKALGILVTDTPVNYWLASRLVSVNSYYVGFGVRYVEYNGGIDSSALCDVTYDASTGYIIVDTDSCAIRPVVTLEAGILDDKAETGLRDNPIVLD